MRDSGQLQSEPGVTIDLSVRRIQVLTCESDIKIVQNLTDRAVPEITSGDSVRHRVHSRVVDSPTRRSIAPWVKLGFGMCTDILRIC